MKNEIIFGICADVHHSAERDEKWRVQKFISEAKERGADFIIQLGDLTTYSEAGREIADLFNSFDGPSYHVLGNHETELSDKQAVLEMLGQKEKYYSFDSGNYHFIVLDTNYELVGGEYLDYCNRRRDFSNCHIPKSQLDWLEADLKATDKRCFIFMHAACEVGDWRIVNLHQFREVLWRENERSGYNKVTMVFSGHDHADAYLFKGGIHYLLLNSASHKFVGKMYTELGSQIESIKSEGRCPEQLISYKEPLYAFVRLKANGLIQIIGKQSEYDGVSPIELHWEHYASPQISYRELWMNGYGEL